MTHYRALPAWALAAALAALAAPPVQAQAGAALAAPTADARGVLHDAGGMTLYTYDPDAAGRSVCDGPCARIWPPALAPADARAAGALDLAVRDDGSRQWAVHGRPLYGYVADVTPGQASGDGVNGNWHVARTTP